MLGLHERIRVHPPPFICRYITCKHRCFTCQGGHKTSGVTTFLCVMNEFCLVLGEKIPHQLSCSSIHVNSERISAQISVSHWCMYQVLTFNGIQKESVRFQFIPEDDNPRVLSVSLLNVQLQVVLIYCIRFLRRYGQLHFETYFLLQLNKIN